MPFDCTKLSTAGYFTSWKEATSTAITIYQALTSTTQLQDNAMMELDKELIDASLCLSTAIQRLSSTSSDIAELNQQILQKTAELSEAEKDIAISKDRVAHIRHPEREVSNYESWFPIDRPISIFSLILIICLTIFLTVFLILLTLSYLGVDITMFTKQAYPGQISMFTPIFEQLTVSFWILLIAFISTVVYFVQRK
jgi:hypothetical protein